MIWNKFRKDGDILVCLATTHNGFQALSLMKKDTDHEIMVKVFDFTKEEPVSLDAIEDTEDLYELGLPWGHVVKANPSDGYGLDLEMSYSNKSNSKYAEYYASFAEWLATCDLDEIG